MVVVAGHNDQCTKSNKRVEKGYARFVMNSARDGKSSSNVMTRLVEMTVLSHSML